MSPFRLRYLSHDIEIAPGDFVIGRSAQCQLAVDDPLVSRRHIVLHVHDDRVELDDLGSRNGAQVNGVRVQGTVPLQPGDRITVGSQQLTLVLGASGAFARRETTRIVRCTECAALVEPGATACRKCGAVVSTRHTTQSQGPEEQTRQANVFTLLLGVAAKALALGHNEEATRLFTTLGADLKTRAESGEEPVEGAVSDASRLALKLSDATQTRQWIDWILDVHALLRRVPASDVVEGLYEVTRRTKYPGGESLTRCIAVLRDSEASFNPGQRFLLKRLEGLARQLGA